MALVKGGVLVDDDWTAVDDETALPDGPVILSLKRWLDLRDTLVGRNGALGVYLAADETPDVLAPDLSRLALICLEFPKFTDGRAYSHARKLRERHGFTGELRATGNVLRDQFQFMHRCGFDAYDVDASSDPSAWLRAVAEISVAYQAAGDRRATIQDQRSV